MAVIMLSKASTRGNHRVHSSFYNLLKRQYEYKSSIDYQHITLVSGTVKMGVIIKSSLLLVLFVVLWEIKESSALSCLPCNKRTCKTPKYCKGGLVKDVCNCCYVCAKVKGETCGGPFQIAGKCAKGLTCRKTPKPGQILFNLRGICSCGPVCRIYCRYGNVHNRFGCPTCRCHKYPRCRRYPYSPYHHGGRRSYPLWHCRRHETVFCKRDCKTCCRHSTTCAPNHWYTRKQRFCHIYRY